MKTKEDLLDAIGDKLTGQLSQEALLEIAKDRFIRSLDNRSIEQLIVFACTVGVLSQLNCGIEGHLSDCRCKFRTTKELNGN